MKQVLETYVANRTTPCIFRTNLYTKMYNFTNIFILKEAIRAVKIYIIDEHFLYDTHYHADATTHGRPPRLHRVMYAQAQKMIQSFGTSALVG